MLDDALNYGAQYMKENKLTNYVVKVKLFPRSAEWKLSNQSFITIVENDKDILIPLPRDQHTKELGFSAVGACVSIVRTGGLVGCTSIVQMTGSISGHTVDYIVSRGKNNEFLIRIVAYYTDKKEQDEDPQ